MEVYKCSQYRSYYEVAKKLTDPKDRLSFYDALDAYRFDGEIIEMTPTVSLVFTAIKPFLDAELGRKAGGAPLKNRNARKQKEAKETEKEASAEEKDVKNKSTKFTPPTVEEVKEYCNERNNSIDPERFIDYYESNGLKVGKNSMKDWKAAVRNWEKPKDTGQEVKANVFPDDKLLL